MKWKQHTLESGALERKRASPRVGAGTLVRRREWCGLRPRPPTATAPAPSPLASGAPRAQPVLWELLTTDPGIWKVGGRTEKLLTGGLGQVLCKRTQSANVVVQSRSRVQLCASAWTAAHHASLSLTVSQSLPKFMSIALVMPSSHHIL